MSFAYTVLSHLLGFEVGFEVEERWLDAEIWWLFSKGTEKHVDYLQKMRKIMKILFNGW